MGDFDEDGHQDLAALVFTGEVEVLLGNGDGTFQPGSALGLLQQLADAFRLVVADLDGDDHEDVVVASDPLTILFGNGDGTFAAPSLLSTGIHPGDVAVGDYDEDGLLDLAVIDSYYDPSMVVIRSLGGRKFAPAEPLAGPGTPVGSGSSIWR